MQSKHKQAGFTLVEIAIVLVIIGLLLGGILKGQEMITQARIKNVVNDFNGITAAHFAYLDRYRAIAGDDIGAATRWVAPNPPGGTKDGNGNGVLAGKYMTAPPASLTVTTGTQVGEESNLFWWHLRLAGFVAGATSGQQAWTQPVNAVGGIVGVQNGAPGVSGSPTTNLTGLVLCSANVADKIASAVDTQVDDQRSQTGHMYGYLQASSNEDVDTLFSAPNYVETGNNQYIICKKI
jgi:prepilin-type N-terminal cleavage/methylation domain-containing protein